jgi:hypothetical protein
MFVSSLGKYKAGFYRSVFLAGVMTNLPFSADWDFYLMGSGWRLG